MSLLWADARRRGVNPLKGLDAPRGYIRKPKSSGPSDEDVKAFWASESVRASAEQAQREARRDARLRFEQKLPTRARVPSKLSPEERRGAVAQKREEDAKAFWAQVRADHMPPRPAYVYPEWAQTKWDREFVDHLEKHRKKLEAELEAAKQRGDYTRERWAVNQIWSVNMAFAERQEQFEKNRRAAQRKGIRL